MKAVRQVVLTVVLVGLLLGYFVHQGLLITGGSVEDFGERVIFAARWLGWLILIAGITFIIWREKPEEEDLGR